MRLSHGYSAISVAAVSVIALAALPALHAQTNPKQASFAEAAAAPAPTLIERYGADDLRSGSLRMPAGKGPFPLVVLIHGGCWTKGYSVRADMEGVSAALAARGLAVWSIEYRQAGDPGGGYPGSFEDVAAAVDHVADLAKRYPLDLSRMIVVGHSAGAHLALWVASRDKLGAPWASTTGVKPRAVVAMDGPGTLAVNIGDDKLVCGKPVIVPFMGATPDAEPARYTVAQPQDHLPLGIPTVLVEGALGEWMDPYADAARAAGDTVTVVRPENANHFDIITPSTAHGTQAIDAIVAAVPKP